MKKTGIVICVLAALVGLAGCSSVVSSDKTDRTKSGIESQGKFKVNTPDEEWFKETALDVAASVNELANDEAYIKIMGGSDEVAEAASDWGDNIADTSGKIAVVIISDSLWGRLMVRRPYPIRPETVLKKMRAWHLEIM